MTMHSNTFKFLANKDGAAQDFLKKKLDGTQGSNFTDVGRLYDDDHELERPSNPRTDAPIESSSSKAPAANNGFTIQGSGTNDDPMYSSGKWGKGGMSPEELADKFGLDRTTAKNADGGNKDNDIWGTDAKGNKVYIGTVTDQSSLMGNSELLNAHSAQADGAEVDHSSGDAKLSSSGDLNGAILNLWNGGGAEAPETPTATPEEKAPIKHSPEIEQAKERVRNYEDDILSGRTSESIYGNSNANKNLVDRVNDKYSLDLNKGMDGIGTPNTGSSAQTASKATESFLDSKKQTVKKDYNFQPQSQ